MAYNNFAETLAAQDSNFFKRIMQSIRDLLTGFRRGGMVSHEKAAQNLLDRLDKIAEKEFRWLEKVVERKTEEKAAESSVSNETTEADTDKGENENDGDTQENDDSRYSVSETLASDLDSILDGTFDAARNELHLGETSNFLTDVIGANGLSLYMPASKAYSSLVTRAEYEKKPYYSEQDNYHGIGKQDFIEILKKSENPIAAFAAPSDEKGNKRQNRIVLVTDKVIRDVESGKEGYAVVIEEVDTYGVAEGKRVRANKAITIYPRTKMNADLALAVSEGRLLDITQKGEHLFAGVRGANSQAAIRKDVLKKNIAHFWENVKWQSEKNKISSSEGKATPSAMQEALQKAGYDIQYTQDFENDSSRRPASDDTSSGADAKETAKEGIGRRYSVSGTHSLDADFGEFDRALQMYQKGDSKNDIVRETGWWLGKDGKWRYEISDKDMKFESKGFVKNPKTVGDYVKHDKLFSAYPELKDIKVTFVDKIGNSETAKGRYIPRLKSIEIRQALEQSEAKNTMLHELQHAIQIIEGFKTGSSKKIGAMLVFNEVYDKVKDDTKFKRYSPDLKMKFVRLMTEQLMGAPFNDLARQNYENDHGEIEARMTVNRADMAVEELKAEPYFNDGILAESSEIQKRFVDNLMTMGYNEKKANQIAKEEIQYDYQHEDGAKPDSERSLGQEGEGAGFGRSSVATNYARSDRRGGQIYGAGEISNPNAVARENGERYDGHLLNGSIDEDVYVRLSASGEIDMDDGAVGYEELKRQVAAQKEQIYRLTKEMVLSHGGTLDAKEVNRFLKETLARYGATLSVKDVERDFQEIVGYLYRNEIVHRDAKGNFLSVEKEKACFFSTYYLLFVFWRKHHMILAIPFCMC